VSVRVEAPDDLRVDGVPEQLRSACENVLRNALRYSPEGGEIVLRARAEGGDCVITTEDQGPGVPPELLEAIFQPLYRVKDSREGVPSGHGIGLAIVARVAALHGGRAFANNREGGGLGVTIRIRAAHPA
jgi:signal transduction histidine kinase